MLDNNHIMNYNVFVKICLSLNWLRSVLSGIPLSSDTERVVYMIRRIEEDRIFTRELIGSKTNEIESEIKGIIDISFSGESAQADYDFFDIKGSALIHGIPGIGKTSIMNNCMSYALEEYGADCYELVPSEIIDSLLGKATQNLSEALQEFESKEKGILFIDELDRLCVNREEEDVSELKRMLIELMQFFDRLRATDEKVVLCCTNVITQIDPALIRRFAVVEEVPCPSKEDVVEFANICMKKSGFRGIVVGIRPNDGVLSMDKVKEVFRRALLKHDSGLISEQFILEGE